MNSQNYPQVNGPMTAPGGAAADMAGTGTSTFQSFLKNELEYHKAMVQMYEMIQAQDAITSDTHAAEMLRTIFLAGMHSLASK